VRYTALGWDKFATVEFTDRASAPMAPLAVAGGLVTDVGIAAADTVAFVALMPYAAVTYTESYFSERNALDRTTWQTVATPVLIPVMMVYMPLLAMISPHGLARSLGWDEGPYGESRKTEDSAEHPMSN